MAVCQHCRQDKPEAPGCEWFDVEITHARPGYRAIATGRYRKVFVCAECMDVDRASRAKHQASLDAAKAYLAECKAAGITPDAERFGALMNGD